MFVYLTWINKGKHLKTMLDYDKAKLFSTKLEELGLEPQVLFESSGNTTALIVKK